MATTQFKAAKVRVEITGEDGITYDVELDGPRALVTFGFEIHTYSRPAEEGMWMETLPTGGATITLEATGKLVKSERRAP